MGNVVLHLVFKLVDELFQFFGLCWWQNLDGIEHLGDKICVAESVRDLWDWILGLFLLEDLLFDLFVGFGLLGLDDFNILHLGPVSFLQGILQLNFLLGISFLGLVYSLSEIFTILD